MKRVLLFFILTGITNLIFSQSIKFSLNAGLNISTASQLPTPQLQSIAVKGQKFPNSNIKGFHIGGCLEFYFNKLSIEPGLFYTTKGGLPSSGGPVVAPGYGNYFNRTDKLTLNYIEMPINMLYHIPIDGAKLFIGGGPYIGIGVSGKGEYSITSISNGTKSTNGGNNGSSNVTFGNSYNDLRNPDYGVNLTSGIILKKGLVFGVNYEFGIANISNDPNYQGHNKVFNISIGYSFL